MKREKLDPHEDCISQALKILDGCRLKHVPGMEATDCRELGRERVLLTKITLLADKWHETIERLERMQKELAVFREVNAETNQKLERKIEEISLLRLITDTTSRAIQSQDPFKLILDKVIAIVGADSGSIMLVNAETGRLEVRTATGEEESDPDSPLFNVAEGIASCVAISGKPSLIDDTHTDPHFALLHEDAHGISSLVSFPLVAENMTVGVLNVSSPHPNAFGKETERIMHIIAGQIAVAVQNATLYGEVRKTKEYLENLVERAGDAIFTLNRAHEVVSWNTGAEVIFKRDKQGVLGSTIYDLVPEDSSPALSEQIGNILDSENIVTMETDAIRGDDQLTQIALTLSPIRNADGEVVGVSGIAKDITERKRVEEELRRLNEAKTNFLSTVSHELRTPLTSIKSFTEVLLHDMTSLSNESSRRYLNIINEECDRLSGLISSLLDLQKLNAGRSEAELEPVLLAEIVRQAAELFESMALQNRIELSREFLVPDHMTKVFGDRKRLMQILSNLLSNAMKYAGAGGHVRIRLARENEGVRLTVSDDGIGIPKSEKDKVFEKFYQVDNPVTRVKGGTGLGLAITKELVTLHGGWIWVESDEGNGCSFNVLVPAAE